MSYVSAKEINSCRASPAPAPAITTGVRASLRRRARALVSAPPGAGRGGSSAGACGGAWTSSPSRSAGTASITGPGRLEVAMRSPLSTNSARRSARWTVADHLVIGAKKDARSTSWKASPEKLRLDLPKQDDHRGRVLPRRMHPDSKVRGADTAGSHRHCRHPGQLRVGLRHKRGARLVPGRDEREIGILLDGVEDLEEALAGYSVETPDARPGQRLHGDGTRSLRGIGHSVCNSPVGLCGIFAVTSYTPLTLTAYSVSGLARKETDGRGDGCGVRCDRADGRRPHARGWSGRRDLDGSAAAADHLERGRSALVAVQSLPGRPCARLGTRDLRGLRRALPLPRERRAHAQGGRDLAPEGPRPVVDERGARRPPVRAGRATARLHRRPRL